MRPRALLPQFLFAAALLFSNANAQDDFDLHWRELRASQPAELHFAISTSKATYFLGEAIPLLLSFTSTEADTFLADTRQYDRIGRMNYIEQFVIDSRSAEDPLHGLVAATGGLGGLSAGPVGLSDKPFSFERVLNEWVRFRKPGTYRLYVVSLRVHPRNETGAVVKVVSNILNLEILPAPAAWMKQKIAAAVQALDASTADQSERLNAGRTLRFLETPESANELAKHLGPGNDVDSYGLHLGVLGSPYRNQLLTVLEQRLIAPDQPVWDRYLDTIATLAELVGSGEANSKRPGEIAGLKRKEYAARVFAYLPSKNVEARAISANTLIGIGVNSAPNAPWFSAVVASLIADFSHLPVLTQSELLEYRWNVLKGPAMIPVLRDLYANPPSPRIDPPLDDLALRRLFELAPAEGRKFVLAEIRQPTRYLRFSTLSMLPDRTLPEFDSVFIEQIRRHNFNEALILRYATGTIVKDVERAYVERNQELDRQKLPHCTSALVFYFLQYDPPFGESELRRNFSTEHGVPACYDIGFQFRDLGAYAMSPALERLAIEYLASPAVPIKRGAAEILGRFGSAAAQEPLWKTLEYFRSWWKDREDQLQQPAGQEGVQFERTLRIALAQAGAWHLNHEGLQRLYDLCSTRWCRQEVADWLKSK